jgi:hypothetical protein
VFAYPQHFFHLINKIMVPPCGTEDECNKPFNVAPPSGK